MPRKQPSSPTTWSTPILPGTTRMASSAWRSIVDWHARGMVLANRHAGSSSAKRASHAVVDGQFGYGQVIGREAMDLAIAKARQSGLCALAIRNAGHLGRIGAWAEQLAAGGLASRAFRQHVGLRHPGRAARRQRPAPVGEPDRRRRAWSRTAAAGSRHRDLAHRRRQDPGRPQPRRGAAARAARSTAAGSPTTDPAAFYGPPPGAHLPVRRPQGLGPVGLLRDPGRLA